MINYIFLSADPAGNRKGYFFFPDASTISLSVFFLSESVRISYVGAIIGLTATTLRRF